MNRKKQLRINMKQQLSQMTDDDYRKRSNEVNMKLIASQVWNDSNTIGVTISTKREVDTLAIIEEGWKQKKRIVVPKCFPENKELRFYQITSFLDVEDSFYSLKEPITSSTTLIEKKDIDLLIVPGLIYDQLGFRIGFGGGYYDRYLSDYKNKTVSLAFNFQIVEEVPKEAFDIPVDQIITDT